MKPIQETLYHLIPIGRYLLAFICGILLQIFLQTSFVVLSIFFTLCVLGILAFDSSKKLTQSFSHRWIAGVASLLTMLSCGSLYTYLKTEKNFELHFSKISSNESFLILRLKEPLVEKAKSYKALMEVEGVLDSLKFLKKTDGKLLVYIAKDSLSKDLRYGDLIYAKVKRTDIKGPMNPGEFNYQRFLYFHQIHQQAYLNSGTWIKLRSKESNFLFEFSYSLRDRLVACMKEYIPDKRNYAVASALTVGYEDDLDQELIQAYASAGALHVLSVSGMHVALIYQLLVMVLMFAIRNTKYRWIHYVIALLFLWFYAILTGYSPSVLRSTVMFTFIILAEWINRNTTTFNTIAVSVFVLLLYDPFIITEVGFQLSYLAVIGIVYLHPLIHVWIEPKYWFTRQIWTITSVSMAAQIATFPLGLLYFHQFPLLFVISNLVVIPLTTLIIYGCIVLIAVSKIGLVASFVGKIVSLMLYATNYSVLFVDSIPSALLTGISITIFETWLIFGMIIFTLVYLASKNAKNIMVVLGMLAVLLCAQIIESLQQKWQKSFVIYNVKNATAIDLIEGRKRIFIGDSALQNDRSKKLFHLTHHRWDIGLSDKNEDWKLYDKNTIYVVGDGKKLAHLCDTVNTTIQKTGTNLITLDWVVVSNNNIESLTNLSNNAQVKQVIIDSSNNNKSKYKIKKFLESRSIPFYDVNEKGAFEYKF